MKLPKLEYEPITSEDMVEWRRWADEAVRAREDIVKASALTHEYVPSYTHDTYADALETVSRMAEKFTMSRDVYISEDLAKRTGITGMLGDENDDPASARKRDKTRLCDTYGKGLKYEEV